MLRYLDNDNYEYVPQHGEPIKLHIDDINHIAEESVEIENSYAYRLNERREFWKDNLSSLRTDIHNLLDAQKEHP